jgi:ferric-dicitrate binding protein FerR (iron transport regulator)
MAEVEELLDEVTVRMPSAAQLRARGDRRLARRRSGVVAAAVVAVVGAVTLAVLPGNGTHETRPE